MRIFPALHAQSSDDLISLFSEIDDLVTGYHIDIMDGKFVPAHTGSAQLTNQIDTLTENILWVHLMVNNPRAYMTELEVKPESIITFHYEAVLSTDLEQLTEYCEQRQWRPSLALNPETRLIDVGHLLHYFDQITIMTVNPGASGQPFISSCLEKIEHLVAYRAAQETSFQIAVDGGITRNIITQLALLNVDAVATHSAVFENQLPRQKLKTLLTDLKSVK